MTDEAQREYLRIYLEENPGEKGRRSRSYTWCQYRSRGVRHVLSFPAGTGMSDRELLHYTGNSPGAGEVLGKGAGAVRSFDRLLPQPILPNHPGLALALS